MVRGIGFPVHLRTLVVVLTAALSATTAWAAHEKTLHSFTGVDGSYPVAGLIWDNAGNLYGTTYWGGTHDNRGTAFELMPNADGTWTRKVLHYFGAGNDGAHPIGGLVFDAAGNLYGTTSEGGAYCESDVRFGCGTVFELSPNGAGGWTERILHNFGDGLDGTFPHAGLIWDSAGNLYGTTTEGGSHNERGTVFELTPRGDGTWTEKTLHNFANSFDGSYAQAPLIFDAAGNLYGTTHLGGAYGEGTVYELSPNGHGGWTERVLHNFRPASQCGNPNAGLIWDAAGNLYGTVYYGGPYLQGAVFELSPNGDGSWTTKFLHYFGNGLDGANPNGSLIFDAAGNLYGTTYDGGANHYHGTVFKLTPNGSGGWTESVVHNFGKGWNPESNLIFDAAGNLYGTTYSGSINGKGTVFEITP